MGAVGRNESTCINVARRFRPTHTAIPFFYRDFPNLKKAKWKIRSPFDDDYQCIAWAAWYADRQMWPHEDYWWFPDAPLFQGFAKEATPDYFIKGFARIGYKPCKSRRFLPGFQKVAIYANDTGVTHMARQRFFGFGWVSKLGDWEDIYHSRLEDIEGDMAATAQQYGKVVQVLKRSWWSVIRKKCAARAFRVTKELREYRRSHKWQAP
jgi:hypothetical protein